MPGRALKLVPALVSETPDDDFDQSAYDRRGLECGDWCGPLHRLDAVVRGKPYVGWFDPIDFMRMDEEERSGRTIVNYKHRLTRHYLHLDEAGKPWGTPRRTKKSNVIVPYGRITILAAFDAVAIWELPWMRSDLESERLGFTWDDRAKHPVVKAALRRMSPLQRSSALR